MGRPREHASDAAKSKAYRQRKALATGQLQDLRHALEEACDRGRSHRLMHGLPDNWIPELIERLATRKLIVCRATTKVEATSTRVCLADPIDKPESHIVLPPRPGRLRSSSS